MASLISLPNNLLILSSSFPTRTKTRSNNYNKFLSMSLLIHPRRQHQSVASFNPVVFNDSLSMESASLGISCLFQRSSCSGLGRKWRTSKVWEGEGDPDLEAEVLEFMKNSDNPNLFPSKEQLIIGGRLDLVKSIVTKGGWLSFGWGLDDVEEEEEEEEVKVQGYEVQARFTEPPAMGDQITDGFMRNDSRIFQNRFDGLGTGECNSLEEFEAENDGASPLLNSNGSSSPPSSSGRTEGGDNAGIEGILSRLKKERTRSFGFGSKDKESKVQGSRNDGEEDLKLGIPEVHGSERSISLTRGSCKDLFDDSGGMHTHSESYSDNNESRNAFKPDMWRKWSNRRAGSSEAEFEAAEFGEHFSRKNDMGEKSTNDTGNLRTELSFGDKNKDYNQIRSRLRYLESKLSSVLRVLSCRTDEVVSDKALKTPSEEAHSLSDSWEFRETEIMKAQDKLRSLRAQLAVLEGKTALKIIEMQKMVEEKQKKIHDTQKALSLLRTACVIWPKSASEVLLAGSFDGWTSQRRMERSSPGIFSLYLKLYPGRYEIKFIVDGVWMIDPLRPIVNNNGYRNNLLIVS